MKRFGEKERDRRKELETEVWHRGNNKAGGMGGRRRKGRETPAKYDSYYKFTPHSRSQMQVYTFQESDSSIHTFFCKHYGVHMRFQNYRCWGSERSPCCFQKNNTVYNCSQSIQFNQLIHPNLSSFLLIL